MGNLRLIRATFCFDLLSADDPGNVRLDATLDGGGLMDVGSPAESSSSPTGVSATSPCSSVHCSCSAAS